MKIHFRNPTFPASVINIIHLLRHYLKEIIIALILAVIAAAAIEGYQHKLRSETMLNNRKAIATLYTHDAKGNVVSQGSGLFITSDGVLATNYHVIKGAAYVTARLPTGAFYLLKGLRDADEKADIAILQFDARETPSVSLGDSDALQVGEEVYAIGTPVNLEGTVSLGGISNPSQEINGERFIQFTAPISPGSSGGGLFNTSGKVIGITAASQNITSGTQAGEAQNLNLAVPINRLKDVLGGGPNYLVKERPEFYYSLGNLADNNRQFDKAIKYYQTALSLNPKYADAYLGLGGDYYEQSQFDLEVANYLRATVADPQNRDAFYLLGTAYEDTGQYADAIAAYERALAIDPKYKDALHDLSIVYLTLGRQDRAQELVPKLMAVDKGWGSELQILLRRLR